MIQKIIKHGSISPLSCRVKSAGVSLIYAGNVGIDGISLILSGKNLLLITLVLFYFSNPAFSQAWQWAKSAGTPQGENPTAICTDLAGNVYVGGSFTGPQMVIGTYTMVNANVGQSDVFLAKYDGNGNVLWAKAIV